MANEMIEKFKDRKFDEPLLHLQTTSLQGKLYQADEAVKARNDGKDQLTDTVIRDLEVFSPSTFHLLFNDPIAIGITIGVELFLTTLVGLKVLDKERITSLYELLAKLNKDVGAAFDKRLFGGEKIGSSDSDQLENLRKFFEQDLIVNERNYDVEVTLKEDEDGRYDIFYDFAPHFKKFLGTEKDKGNGKLYSDFTIKDVLRDLNLFTLADQSSPGYLMEQLNCFIDDELNNTAIESINDPSDINEKEQGIAAKLNLLCAKIKNLNIDKFYEYDGSGQKARKIFALAKLLPLFLDKDTLDEKTTIQKSRIRFIEEFNKITKMDVATDVANSLYEAAFKYWLVSSVAALILSSFDMTKWPTAVLTAVLAVTGSYAVGHKTIQEANKALAKQDVSKIEEISQQANIYYDESLKDRQLTRLAMATVYQITSERIANELKMAEEKNTDSGADGKQAAINKKIKDILENKSGAVKSKTKTSAQKVYSSITCDVDSVDEHIAILEKMTAEKQRANRAIRAASTIFGLAIQISFVQWVASVVVYWVCKIGVTSAPVVAANAFLNLSWMGGLLSVGLFAVGMGIGAIHYSIKVSKELKELREKIKKQYDYKKNKIGKIAEIEKQNQALKALLLAQNKTPVKMIDAAYDHDFQSKSPERSTIKNALRVAGSTVQQAINTLGTGILINRSLLIPGVTLLGLTGISKVAVVGGIAGVVIGGFSVIAWPVTIAVLAISAIWMGVKIYEHRQKKKYEQTLNFLNDVDNRLQAAEKERDTLLQQLNYTESERPKMTRETINVCTTAQLQKVLETSCKEEAAVKLKPSTSVVLEKAPENAGAPLLSTSKPRPSIASVVGDFFKRMISDPNPISETPSVQKTCAQESEQPLNAGAVVPGVGQTVSV